MDWLRKSFTAPSKWIAPTSAPSTIVPYVTPSAEFGEAAAGTSLRSQISQYAPPGPVTSIEPDASVARTSAESSAGAGEFPAAALYSCAEAGAVKHNAASIVVAINAVTIIAVKMFVAKNDDEVLRIIQSS